MQSIINMGRFLTIWMTNDSRDLGQALSPNLTVKTLCQVTSSSKQLPSPSLITDAVLPEEVSGKGRYGVDRVTNEAADSVGVKSEEEGDEEMVRVPEGLERLLADAVVRGGVHQQHAEEHDVASNTAGLGVVDLDGGDLSELGLLHVEETKKAVRPVCFWSPLVWRERLT